MVAPPGGCDARAAAAAAAAPVGWDGIGASPNGSASRGSRASEGMLTGPGRVLGTTGGSSISPNAPLGGPEGAAGGGPMSRSSSPNPGNDGDGARAGAIDGSAARARRPPP